MNSRNNDGVRTTLSGEYAALITPVADDGRPDASLLVDLVDFVIARGVHGLCLGGGTAEYPHFSIKDRKRIVEIAAQHLDGRYPFITAIGAPTMRSVLELGEHALSRGSKALLLPMPFFYQYGQEDLAGYIHACVMALDAPCMLYNLPAFTNSLEPETAVRLLQSLPNLVGVKDSSGNRGALSLFEKARVDSPFTLMCGSDGVFFDSLEAGWDGGISGIASCCPELLVALLTHYRAGRKAEAQACQRLLDELVDMVNRLPFPWSIRIAAEVRGLPNGPLPYPLSERRRTQVIKLRREYESWFDENLTAILSENVRYSL